MILAFPGPFPFPPTAGGTAAPPPPTDVIPGTNVEWLWVKHYARAHATRKQILAGLGLPKEVTDKPELMARLHREIEQGRALYQLDLLEALRIRGIVDGSVNTLLASAREVLRWEKHERKEEAAPDSEAAEAELQRLLGHLVKKSRKGQRAR